MPTNPADGPILGTLYGSDAMRAVFDERAYFQRMLDAEAALARAEGRLGIIPAEAASAITAAARFENLDPAVLAASARSVGYPVVGLVRELSRAAGEAGRWTHWGATTQDIMDTATVLQARAGLRPVRAELAAVRAAPAGQAARHRDTVMAGRKQLQQALALTRPQAIRRRSTIGVELVTAYIQRHEYDAAAVLLHEARSWAQQAQSRVNLQRLAQIEPHLISTGQYQ